jgi:hypothetical protein
LPLLSNELQKPLGLSEEEAEELREMAQAMKTDWAEQWQAEIRAANVQWDNVNARAARLMDMYLDNAIDRSLFEEKKFFLLMERKALEERRAQIEAGEQSAAQDMLKYLELAETLPLSYEIRNTDEKREVLKSITSNLAVDGKNVVVELRSPFREIDKLTGSDWCISSGQTSNPRDADLRKPMFDIRLMKSSPRPREHSRGRLHPYQFSGTRMAGPSAVSGGRRSGYPAL